MVVSGALAGLAGAAGSPSPLPPAGMLRPGTYATQAFKPSFSFTVGTGWSVGGLGDSVGLVVLQDAKLASTESLSFTNLRSECSRFGFTQPIPSPRQVVASLRSRPYVAAADPRPAKIGGLSGLAIDFTVVSRLPASPKRAPCLAFLSTVIPGDPFRLSLWKVGSKHRLIALEVRRESVVVEIIGPGSDFRRFAAKAEALLRTVRWR